MWLHFLAHPKRGKGLSLCQYFTLKGPCQRKATTTLYKVRVCTQHQSCISRQHLTSNEQKIKVGKSKIGNSLLGISSGKGRACIAKTDIKKNEWILVCSPLHPNEKGKWKMMNRKAQIKWYQENSESPMDSMWICEIGKKKSYLIDTKIGDARDLKAVGSPWYSLNHSKKPNAAPVMFLNQTGKFLAIVLVAKRDIEKEEEITFRYFSFPFEDQMTY